MQHLLHAAILLPLPAAPTSITHLLLLPAAFSCCSIACIACLSFLRCKHDLLLLPAASTSFIHLLLLPAAIACCRIACISCFSCLQQTACINCFSCLLLSPSPTCCYYLLRLPAGWPAAFLALPAARGAPWRLQTRVPGSPRPQAFSSSSVCTSGSCKREKSSFKWQDRLAVARFDRWLYL